MVDCCSSTPTGKNVECNQDFTGKELKYGLKFPENFDFKKIQEYQPEPVKCILVLEDGREVECELVHTLKPTPGKEYNPVFSVNFPSDTDLG